MITKKYHIEMIIKFIDLKLILPSRSSFDACEDVFRMIKTFLKSINKQILRSEFNPFRQSTDIN